MLNYELFGSAVAEEKVHWRCAVFSGSSKKALLVGSFFGSLPEARKHAEAAVLRVKERLKKQHLGRVLKTRQRELELTVSGLGAE